MRLSIFYRRKLPIKVLVSIVLLISLPGCATRQVTDTLQGSTAQRLVTYSLEAFIRKLLAEPTISSLSNNSVELRVNFLQSHPMTNYARALLTQQLFETHRIRVASVADSAESTIDVFFNSLGTDHDSYGLSLPTFGITTTPDARINVLAVDMFHGVTEGYAIIRTGEHGIERTSRLLARVRTDSFATPVVDFPVNQLD